MTSLFDPLRCGDLTLANRIVMAPLTRNRAGPGAVPTPLMATYYSQRAGAGLIVSEGTQISAEAQGYIDTPGIHSEAQVEGWRRVTDAVHERGGRIVAQLWHVGRISHVSLQAGGQSPVSSTARAAGSSTFTAKGFEPVSKPRALVTAEIARVIDDYRHAARQARAAGFDGIELHAANGYLIEQFLRDSINDRDDDYGGEPANRVRLLVEVMTALCDELGAGRCGVRLSPVTPANDASQDSDPQALYELAVRRIGALAPAYVHVVEGATGGARDVAPFDFAALREVFKSAHPDGAWIVNNGYSRQMAIDVIAEGRADAVAFGRPFISNPDLVERLRLGAALTPPQRDTFYGGGAAGYTDYPTLAQQTA